MDYESILYALALMLVGSLLVWAVPVGFIKLGNDLRARRALARELKASAATLPARSRTTVPWLVALRGRG